MIELMWGWIQTLGGIIQQINVFVVDNLTGFLLLITAIAAIAAYRKATKVHDNQESIERLANAIIKQYNKDLREKA
jgi:hypothetical protein